MDYLERNPIPVECQKCSDPDCDVCEIGTERWYIPHDQELRLQKKGLMKALYRERKKGHPTDWIEFRIEEIERQLLPFSQTQLDAIEHRSQMTKELFDSCIAVCIRARDPEMQEALSVTYPAFAL